MKPELSVVVPVFNEEEVIKATQQRLTAVLSDLQLTYEIIYINDGSTDRTAEIIRPWCLTDGKVKLISFSRNFGHQTAITCGMDYAAGDAIVIIDADLQDPPEVIPQLIEKWREGYEVVYARRKKRAGETRFKKTTASLYYRFLYRLSDVDIPVDVGDFRLIDSTVRDALLQLPEHNRYVRGLIAWLGYRQTFVDYERAPRQAGTTKYPLRKMLKLAGDGITSFSYRPLKISIYLGVFLSLASFLFLLFIFISKLFNLVAMEPGYASMMSVILFFFGVVLIMLGITGEYIGRIFEEVKSRPLYLVLREDGKFYTKGRCGTRPGLPHPDSIHIDGKSSLDEDA
ncbi:MAG: glycosyltransferase family 2 protein [Clostridiaceae bacterium]|jgi:glycosyltransferase involved in cell wall biosynthesis|nr:glycosyltransferase family 2 protein [Clostridiaceae bacterium]